MTERSEDTEGTDDTGERQDIAARIRDRLLAGLRIAVLLVAVGVQFGLCLAQLLSHAGWYSAMWPEVTAFVALAVVAAGCAWFSLRGKAIPVVPRWIGTIVTLGASVLATSAVPASLYLRTEHWSFGLVGWYALALLCDAGLGAFVGFVGVHLLLTAVGLAIVGPAHLPLETIGVTAISVCGYQIAVAASVLVFRRVADHVGHGAAVEERLRIEEVIAEHRHRDHRKRYAALMGTAGPLLAGLADESLDPSEGDTRRRCAVEAAKMRRLFAESDDVSDRLVHELGAGIDVAERNGVTVRFAVRGAPQELPTRVRCELVEPASAALAAAVSDARATVVRSPEQVRVSVLSDAPADLLSGFRAQHVQIVTVVKGDRLWVEAVWRPKTSSK